MLARASHISHGNTANSAAAADAQGSPAHPQHSDQDAHSIVRRAPAIYSGEDDAHDDGAAESDVNDGSAFP